MNKKDLLFFTPSLQEITSGNLIGKFAIRSRTQYIYIPFLITTGDTEYSAFMEFLYDELKKECPRYNTISDMATIRVVRTPEHNFILLGITTHSPSTSNSLILDGNKDVLGYIKYKDMRFLVFGEESRKYFKVFPFKRFIKVRCIGTEERNGVFDGGIFWKVKIDTDDSE